MPKKSNKKPVKVKSPSFRNLPAYVRREAARCHYNTIVIERDNPEKTVLVRAHWRRKPARSSKANSRKQTREDHFIRLLRLHD